MTTFTKKNAAKQYGIARTMENTSDVGLEDWINAHLALKSDLEGKQRNRKTVNVSKQTVQYGCLTQDYVTLFKEHLPPTGWLLYQSPYTCAFFSVLQLLTLVSALNVKRFKIHKELQVLSDLFTPGKPGPAKVSIVELVRRYKESRSQEENWKIFKQLSVSSLESGYVVAWFQAMLRMCNVPCHVVRSDKHVECLEILQSFGTSFAASVDSETTTVQTVMEFLEDTMQEVKGGCIMYGEMQTGADGNTEEVDRHCVSFLRKSEKEFEKGFDVYDSYDRNVTNWKATAREIGTFPCYRVCGLVLQA